MFFSSKIWRILLVVFAVVLAFQFFWICAVRAEGPTPTPTVARDGMADPQSWVKPPPDGPTQADHGAFIYWQRCMVCHGDAGQGLALFRASYPKADQNCSSPRCHGGPRSLAGFGFPDAPAIIGPGTLARFHSAADLYDFIRTRMPYQAPGGLSSSDYWSLAAYLLKQHGVLPEGMQLDATNAASISLQPGSFPTNWLVIGAVPIALVAVGALIFLRRRRHGA